MQLTNDLLNFRKEINVIDTKIVELLAKRKNLVLNIARSKIKNNQPIRDIEREKKLLIKLTNLGKKYDLNINYITRLFQLIIKESVLMQNNLLKENIKKHNINNLNFSFLGPKGSYSDIAASQYAKKYCKQYSTQEFSNFEKVIISVEKNISNYAILPIENNCSGIIYEVIRIIQNKNLFIIGEINISIHHCLFATEKISLNKIKIIYSHSQPFQQCSNFINQFPKWKIQYTSSTSSAIKKIAMLNNPTNAAIGNKKAAKIYGLKILSKNISNQKKNITRFVCLGKKPIKDILQKEMKTTLIFNSENNFKEVYKNLYNEKINIKKLYDKDNISSKKNIFYVDIKENISSDVVQNTLKKIKKISNFFKILGCYPNENKIKKY